MVTNTCHERGPKQIAMTYRSHLLPCPLLRYIEQLSREGVRKIFMCFVFIGRSSLPALLRLWRSPRRESRSTPDTRANSSRALLIPWKKPGRNSSSRFRKIWEGLSRVESVSQRGLRPGWGSKVFSMLGAFPMFLGERHS